MNQGRSTFSHRLMLRYLHPGSADTTPRHATDRRVRHFVTALGYIHRHTASSVGCIPNCHRLEYLYLWLTCFYRHRLPPAVHVKYPTWHSCPVHMAAVTSSRGRPARVEVPHLAQVAGARGGHDVISRAEPTPVQTQARALVAQVAALWGVQGTGQLRS